MRIPVPPCLAVLAVLVSPATAFYPYHYGDDSPSSNSRRTDSQPRAESLGLTLPIRRVPSPLRNRENAYNIVSSKKPKQDNSVAIDQDGGDLSYMVGVTIGSSKKEYHLLLDSAASNTWVMGQDCTSEACKTHNTFGSGDSSSLKTQSTPFSITYGTGSVSGTLATDTLHLGPLSPLLTFGLATNVSQEFRSYPMDGILGIGRGVKVDGSIDAPLIMDVLSSTKLIGAKIYGLHLSRSTDSLADGELNLGSLNKDRFDGDVNYISTLANENGFWEIPVDDAGVNDKMLGISGRSAIIDTGTSFILMPAPDALKIHQQFQGFKQDGETFSVPCDNAATVSFTLGKRSYTISNADWKGGKIASGLCRSNIIGRQTFKESQWLVGDVFLKNVYAVFDFEGRKVGFGTKGGSQSLSQSSSSSSTVQSAARSSGVVASPTGGAGGQAQTAGLAGPAASSATPGAQTGQKDEKSGSARAKLSTIGMYLTVLASLYITR